MNCLNFVSLKCVGVSCTLNGFCNILLAAVIQVSQMLTYFITQYQKFTFVTISIALIGKVFKCLGNWEALLVADMFSKSLIFA